MFLFDVAGIIDKTTSIAGNMRRESAFAMLSVIQG